MKINFLLRICRSITNTYLHTNFSDVIHDATECR